MLCYSNGDPTRRSVRDEFAGEDWDTFSKCLQEDTVPGNNGGIGIFFTTDEITPPLPKGPTIRAQAGSSKPERVNSFKKSAQNCRAVIEQRALAVRSHLESYLQSSWSLLWMHSCCLLEGQVR